MTTAGGSISRTASQLWRRMHQPSAAGTGLPAGLRQMSSAESTPDKKLDGNVAIITGASGVIGEATARLFAAHGAQVIVADVADEKGRNICSEIGSNAHYRHCDVSKEEDVASTVDFAVEKFGKLDIMFNNAGIITPKGTFEGLNLDDYDRYTAIMVRGVVVGIKHAARVMIPMKQGVILSTGSTASRKTGDGYPLIYNINKFNIPGMTTVAAYHLGKHGIRVNAVSPHGIITPVVFAWLENYGVHPSHEDVARSFIKDSSLLGKRCTETDIAKAALFLCSDDAGYISGQNLVVDGGWCGHKEVNVAADLLSLAKKQT